MSDIFISYSSKDRERIQPLVRTLEHLGFSVWWDRMIPMGKAFDDVIVVMVGPPDPPVPLLAAVILPFESTVKLVFV